MYPKIFHNRIKTPYTDCIHNFTQNSVCSSKWLSIIQETRGIFRSIRFISVFTQLFILPNGLADKWVSRLRKVNCGNPDVTVVLCLGVTDYYPPQGQRPMWREISARSYAQLQHVPPTLPYTFTAQYMYNSDAFSSFGLNIYFHLRSSPCWYYYENVVCFVWL